MSLCPLPCLRSCHNVTESHILSFDHMSYIGGWVVYAGTIVTGLDLPWSDLVNIFVSFLVFHLVCGVIAGGMR